MKFFMFELSLFFALLVVSLQMASYSSKIFLQMLNKISKNSKSTTQQQQRGPTQQHHQHSQRYIYPTVIEKTKENIPLD